jgi:small RNA activating complex (SNAPc) subunit SNAP50
MDITVLGSQDLTLLADAIRCVSDETFNPAKFPSSFFFVEGTFYVDRRNGAFELMYCVTFYIISLRASEHLDCCPPSLSVHHWSVGIRIETRSPHFVHMVFRRRAPN